MVKSFTYQLFGYNIRCVQDNASVAELRTWNHISGPSPSVDVVSLKLVRPKLVSQ
jgi:hypothetical protein